MKRIILASQSPRRRELMQLLNLIYDVIPSDCEEDCNLSDPASYVMELSRMKAENVAAKVTDDAIVIGADTIVVCDGLILGKPADAQEAFDTLSHLSGNVHEVFTGMTLIDCVSGSSTSFCERTEVEFYDLLEQEIRDYIATGDPFDKAGGYGVQSKGAFLVKGIRGDFYNVVGLPVARLYRELKQFGELVF